MRRVGIVLAIAFLLPASLLRGQELFFHLSLDSVGTGSGSTAKGTGYLTLSPDRTTLGYAMTVNGLTGPITAAQFALAGLGTTLHTIVFAGNTAEGSWAFPDSLLDELIFQQIVVTVRTSASPGGEISGTAKPHQLGFGFKLDGTQAGTSSSGKGTGYIRFSDSSNAFNRIQYRFTYAGLNGTITAAHFHSLPDGQPVLALAFVDSTVDGTWTTPPDSIWWKLMRGQLYVNIHTTASAGGEIRATPTWVGEAPFIGAMDGSQAGTASNGTGTVWGILHSDLSFSYNATYNHLQGSYTLSHFHQSRTGGVVKAVTFTANHTSGVWTGLADQTLADLFQGRIYLNIHSSTASGGEIRGSLVFLDGSVMAELTGAAAGTASPALGTIWGSFFEDSLQYHATVAGLSSASTDGQFHLSPGGSTLATVPVTDSTAAGFWVFGSNFLDLIRGNVYFTVQTANFGGGEVRGDLKLGSGIATGVAEPLPAVPDRFTLSQNFPNPFNPTTAIEFGVARSGRATVRVYNLLGQTVATLTDDRVSPGVYRVSFDGARLASGVYFYTLSLDGTALQTRKMLLLK